jgi:hypothetical protein
LPGWQTSFPIPALPAGIIVRATILTKVRGAWVNFDAISFTATAG